MASPSPVASPQVPTPPVSPAVGATPWASYQPPARRREASMPPLTRSFTAEREGDVVHELLNQGPRRRAHADGTMDGLYVDCSGGLGHSRRILPRLSVTARLVVFVDNTVLPEARALAEQDPRLRIAQRPMEQLAEEVGHEEVDGVLIDRSGPGPQRLDIFADVELDLRVSPEVGVPAWRWLQEASTEEIAWVLREYGEHGDPLMSERIAEHIKHTQSLRPIRSNKELACVVGVAKQNGDERAVWPTFHALMVFLNQEMEQLDAMLHAACEQLAHQGRCVVITSKDKEGRAVVRFVREHEEPEVGGRWPNQSRVLELYPLVGTDSRFCVIMSRSPFQTTEADFRENRPRRSKGRLRFPEFHRMIGKVANPMPIEELMAFWREVDREGCGEASAADFDSAVYRLQVDTWPNLDEQGISRVIQILNTAAEKWHRAAGNWYKVFQACDEDGSGTMTFDEMLSVFRKSFPGLCISAQQLPERDLRGFWRALDAHRAGRVEVYDFMIFMRKYGAQFSMHRSVRGRRQEEVEDLGHPAERTDDELRHTAYVLDESLTAYWNRRGVHVRAVDKWQRFLDEADLDRDGLVTFQDLETALIMRLKSGRKFIDDNAMLAFSSKVLAQFSTDGAVVNGVSHDDLYALWCRVDADNSGRVSYLEWTNGMYRLRLDTWPVLSDSQQGEVVDKISAAASKRMGTSTNSTCWYKVFKLVDVDGSGEIGYDEFFKIIRRPLPCLAISVKEIPNEDLKGLWKAMDQDLSGSISAQEFMVFMRRLEVRRGVAQWKPQMLSGARVAVLARAKAPSSQLSPAQLASVQERLRRLPIQDLKKAYDDRGWTWQGTISEWEWHQVVREVLMVSEEELDDDCVFTAWARLDKENLGELPVEVLMQSEDA
ncbi:unnamed protein product [Effrenium voratum]|nr:unnamed protein product [Effrenium voratum]